jgi:hypothetical protein
MGKLLQQVLGWSASRQGEDGPFIIIRKRTGDNEEYCISGDCEDLIKSGFFTGLTGTVI